MSSWQSFFNQLSRPINNGILPNSDEICHCNKGSLVHHRLKNGSSVYEPLKDCSLKSVCCAIQIDKHRVNSS